MTGVNLRPCNHCCTPFHPSHHLAGFCSDVCRTEARRTYQRNWRAVKGGYKPMVGTERFCRHCKEPFIVPNRPGRGLTCSPSCQTAYKRESNRLGGKARRLAAGQPTTVHCRYCGQIFTPSKYRLRLCSERCAEEYPRQRTREWHRRRVSV